MESLQDPDYARLYLQRAAADGVDELFHALGNVARSRVKDINATASESELSRENPRLEADRNGDPRARTLDALLETIGLRLDVTLRAIEPEEKKTTKTSPQVPDEEHDRARA
jgi:DNA-binding phage protein